MPLSQHDIKLKKMLDQEVLARNTSYELSYEKPDPLLVASRYLDEYAILLCALFGYGKASVIVNFLDRLDVTLLDASEEVIEKELKGFYYRFQNSEDVIAIFKALRRLKQQQSLNTLFYEAYKKDASVLEGIDAIIDAIYQSLDYNSRGYTFLISTPMKRNRLNQIKPNGNSPYKRWNMFLRWMVRTDALDLGLWKNIDTKDLILPLDTHTFNVSKRLGILTRKSYDLHAALLITNRLKMFDFKDPIKYDFALYRLGQEHLY